MFCGRNLLFLFHTFLFQVLIAPLHLWPFLYYYVFSVWTGVTQRDTSPASFPQLLIFFYQFLTPPPPSSFTIQKFTCDYIPLFLILEKYKLTSPPSMLPSPSSSCWSFLWRFLFAAEFFCLLESFNDRYEQLLVGGKNLRVQRALLFLWQGHRGQLLRLPETVKMLQGLP